MLRDLNDLQFFAAVVQHRGFSAGAPALGIRADSISPGVIATNQTPEQLKDPEWAGYMLGKTLLGRQKWRTSLCSWPPMTVRT
jgi:hypothetical protein